MFRDMAFYMFGKPLDSFVQLFIFEPIVIGIIAILVAMITKSHGQFCYNHCFKYC